MIRLEGRVVPRLDEFMLRLGHLKVLCNVACELASSKHRIFTGTAEILTRKVGIPQNSEGIVADYLKRKKLCSVITDSERRTGFPDKDFRYPDIAVISDCSGAETVRSIDTGEDSPRIWWQDLCLADKNVCSKVGAVTTEAKSGGTTGLSHIFDWAELRTPRSLHYQEGYW